jgi:hypothetical protein
MTWALRLCIAAASAIALADCTVKGDVHVYNNTQDVIVVIADSKTHTVMPATQVDFQYSNILHVDFGQDRATYELPVTAPEYIGGGGGRAHVSLQVQPDRRLFVLEAHDRPPIQVEDYSQPPGYPISPHVSGP